MTATFQFSPTPEGGNVVLLERHLLGRRQVPVLDWQLAGAPELLTAIRYLRKLVDGGLAQTDGTTLVIPVAALVEIPAGIMRRIGLPEVAPLNLSLSLAGRVETPEGEIKATWSDSNARRVIPKREGMFVTFGRDTGRLTAPVFRLLEAIGDYNATLGQPGDARLPAWLVVQKQLEPLVGTTVKADQLLQNLRIYQAGAFALDVKESVDGPRFDPVLMTADMRSSLEDDAPAPDGDFGDDPDSEPKDNDRDALLVPELQHRFVEAFNADPSMRPSYVLGRNTYLVIEPELRSALDVVKRIGRSPERERREFLRNPRTYIAQALPEAGEEIGTLFVETRQYSDRVQGLGVWEKPKLDWLLRKGSGWLPEGFVLQVGGRPVRLDESGVADLAQALDAALEHGTDTVTFRGDAFSSTDVATALEGLRGEFGEAGGQEDFADADQVHSRDVDVLLIKDNIDDPEFTVTERPRPLVVPRVFPSDLVRTDPKPHQSTGFGWLVDAWTSGLPGALLADDMGLGKTMQALAFLAWFRSNRRAAGAKSEGFRGPILIVAPTALLRNWQKEAERHLVEGCLGECVEAFGPGLKAIKSRGAVSLEDALDVARLRDADWILTTYETLATYHRAFARVAYSVVIFDEMQKIKAPDTINTHAAKVMNADFVLGMTGTPIENRIEDIWCIMDRVIPGHLGGLRDFSKAYGGEDADALRELKGKLDQPQGRLPAPMLRRMKHDHLKGLPERHVRPYRDTVMPAVQAEAYARVVAAANGGSRTKGDMLKTIHSLRGISLHPHGADGLDPYDAASRQRWIESSARVSQTLKILDVIKRSGEKALVFIEDRAVQSAFATIAAARFDLSAEPEVINGELAGERRQQVVDRFQSAPPGFGLLVLSPKAAGIGLTITAANHVVHLSRWWNPAVEDQCNDRVYRIGQTRPVIVHIPMAVHPEFGEASFDLKLDALLERKRALSRDMLAPPVSDSDAETLFGEAVTSVSTRS